MRDAIRSPFAQDLVERFARFRVVLVEPKFSGNLGLVARAMSTAGFTDLHLVRPRAAVDPEARNLAMAGRPILDSATAHESLEQALVGIDLALAVTRFGGRMRPNPVSPAGAARLLLDLLPGSRAALVFGAEDRGLSRADCAPAWAFVSIPTGGSGSLNLALAVAVVLHAFAARALERVPEGSLAAEERASAARRLIELLTSVGFLEPADSPHLVPKVLATLARLELDAREIKILHGVLGQLEKHLRPINEGPAS